MQLFKRIITAAIAGSFMLPVAAQSPAEPAPQAANAIERIVVESDSNVTIDIPQSILDDLLREQVSKPQKQEQHLRPGINKMSGFRIQVFSDGRNQHSLERRAKARGNAIAARFPKYRGQVYTSSSSPNWYTRIGNFRTQAEAQAAIAELKRAFPQFASEMRVVKSQIVVIK